MFETVCGTGHRPDKMLGGWRNYKSANGALIDRVTKNLINLNKEYSTKDVLCGMALGWDTIIAIAAMEARKNAKDIRLVACVPCSQQECKWQEEDRELYRCIMEQADEVVYVTPGAYIEDTSCMWKRNCYMVERCTGILAYYNGMESGLHYANKMEDIQGPGGTAHCLRYARKWAKDKHLELPVYNYCTDKD